MSWSNPDVQRHGQGQGDGHLDVYFTFLLLHYLTFMVKRDAPPDVEL